MSDDTQETPKAESALVGAETLLETLFPVERDRPTLRWLAEMRAKKRIPYIKIGNRIIRYNVANVRKAIDESFTIPSIDINRQK